MGDDTDTTRPGPVVDTSAPVISTTAFGPFEFPVLCPTRCGPGGRLGRVCLPAPPGPVESGPVDRRLHRRGGRRSCLIPLALVPERFGSVGPVSLCLGSGENSLEYPKPPGLWFSTTSFRHHRPWVQSRRVVPRTMSLQRDGSRQGVWLPRTTAASSCLATS